MGGLGILISLVIEGYGKSKKKKKVEVKTSSRPRIVVKPRQ